MLFVPELFQRFFQLRLLRHFQVDPFVGVISGQTDFLVQTGIEFSGGGLKSNDNNPLILFQQHPGLLLSSRVLSNPFLRLIPIAYFGFSGGQCLFPVFKYLFMPARRFQFNFIICQVIPNRFY